MLNRNLLCYYVSSVKKRAKISMLAKVAMTAKFCLSLLSLFMSSSYTLDIYSLFTTIIL